MKQTIVALPVFVLRDYEISRRHFYFTTVSNIYGDDIIYADPKISSSTPANIYRRPVRVLLPCRILLRCPLFDVW